MMSTVTGTLTPRFDLLKPTLDPNDVWGCEINLNLDKIDDAAKQAELLTVSGNLQTQITSNDSDIATNVIDIAANTTLITTTSGHLQTQIDAVEASDVDSITASGTAIASSRCATSVVCPKKRGTD